MKIIPLKSLLNIIFLSLILVWAPNCSDDKSDAQSTEEENADENEDEDENEEEDNEEEDNKEDNEEEEKEEKEVNLYEQPFDCNEEVLGFGDFIGPAYVEMEAALQLVGGDAQITFTVECPESLGEAADLGENNYVIKNGTFSGQGDANIENNVSDEGPGTIEVSYSFIGQLTGTYNIETYEIELNLEGNINLDTNQGNTSAPISGEMEGLFDIENDKYSGNYFSMGSIPVAGLSFPYEARGRWLGLRPGVEDDSLDTSPLFE